MKINVYNVSKYAFVSTILFGAKSLEIKMSGEKSIKTLCDNSACALSLLQPSSCLPKSFSLQVKRLIWEYAGVRGGSAWKVIADADLNLRCYDSKLKL